jgi:phytol kinase
MAGGWPQQLVGVAAVAGWLTLLAIAAREVRRRWNGQREWSRKLVHIGTGAVVPIAWACSIDRLIAVPAAGAITLVAAFNHRFRLLPAIEDVGRTSYGTIAYGASITLLLLLFWPEHPAAVAAGVLVMAVGDGLAGLLGPLLASPSWRIWGQRKSIVVRQLAVAADLPHPGPVTLLAIATLAVALEQVAVMGLDNFTVPLATGWLWQQFS